MFSIRDRQTCQLAILALGVGTSAQGHAEGEGHAENFVANSELIRGCFMQAHFGWWTHWFGFNDIGPDENTTGYSLYYAIYNVPICFVSTPRNSCTAETFPICLEGTNIAHGGHCTLDCPEGFSPTSDRLLCLFGDLFPSNYTCLPSWQSRDACNFTVTIGNSSFPGCLSHTVRGTRCQRPWQSKSLTAPELLPKTKEPFPSGGM